MEINLKKIGARVRAARKSLGLSQEELAERCGCSSVFISHVELGHASPSFQLFLHICGALEITPDSLLLDVPELYNRNFVEGSLAAKLQMLTTDDLDIVSEIVDVFLKRKNCRA